MDRDYRQNLASFLHAMRKESGLTQYEFGSQYGISGPAVFKFEKGYVKPSLKLWLRIAADGGMDERRAVFYWARAALPNDLQHYVEIQSSGSRGDKNATHGKPKKPEKELDYSKFKDRLEIQEAASDDQTLASGLAELLLDDELWGLMMPTGDEVNQLRRVFSPLGWGSKDLYREALRTIRAFKGKNVE